MVSNLAENWWALVIRGVAGVVFGIAALVWPPGAVAALVLLFGAYALVDGIFNLIAAFRAPRKESAGGWLAFSGVTGVATGLIAFFFPGITALALVLLVAAWSLVTGIAEIVVPSGCAGRSSTNGCSASLGCSRSPSECCFPDAGSGRLPWRSGSAHTRSCSAGC